MTLGLKRLPEPGLPQEAPGQPRAPWWVLLRRLGSNERLATFVLLSCVVLSAVWSLEKARWVPALHSLSWVAVVALVTGYLVTRSRWPGILLHLISAVLGSWIVLWQTSLLLPADSWGSRLWGVLIELKEWGHAVITGETTGGVITYAVMLLGLTWLLGYVSAWLVFRGHRVWWVILFSALMILINLSSLPSRFYVHLIPFLIASLFLIAHSNIVRRQQRWRRSQVRYPRFARVSFLGYALCFGLLVALIVWSLPLFRPAPLGDLVQPVSSAWEQHVQYQLNRLFASIQSKNPNYHVSDPTTLHFGGPLNLSDQIIFTVDSSEPRYWRIRNYDVYTSDSWLSSEGVEIPLEERDSGLKVEPLLMRASIPHTLTLNVYSPVFFSAGEPLSVDVSATAEIRKPQTQSGPDDVVLFRLEGGWNLRPFQEYTLVSSYSVATPDDMRTAGMNYPSWVLNSYLNLPSELPNRVILLSQEITQGIDNPYDRTLAVQSYLLEMQYSENISAPPQGADGVDYFLFEQRVGYCEYFASAMVAMLRSIEIPSRLVVGYSGGELDEDKGIYVVRERNYHAWAEVYFPQYGWVEFDPTPGSGQSTGPPIMGSQAGLPPSGPAPIPTTNNPSSTWVLWVVLTSAAGLIVLGRVAIILSRRRSRHNMAKLDYPAQVYARMCRLASLSRLAPKPQHTPLEYASRLALALPSRTTAIEQVAQTYSEVQYSARKDLAVREKEDLEKAWHYLRMALWGRFLKSGVTYLLKGKRRSSDGP